MAAAALIDELRYEHGLASFRLGGDFFALDLQLVSEINRQIDLTPVRTAPDYVCGLVNLRGQIVTVVDVAQRIGLPSAELGPESRLLVLKTDAELAQLNLKRLSTTEHKIGFLVDAIGDVVTPTDDQLEPPPANLGAVARRFLVGVCKTPDEVIGILDVGGLVAAPEMER